MTKLPTARKLRTRKADPEQVYTRDVTLDYRKADTESRVVPATLSSEQPVKRWFGNEILRHDSDSVDLARAADGLPLLFNHNTDSFIGAVRNVRVEAGTLKGDLHFSQNSRATEVWNDVKDGLLRNMSIGYKIEEAEEGKNGDITATRWQLAEASIAPVPADQSVGINRKEEKPVMSTENHNQATEAREAEQARIEGIRNVFTGGKRSYTDPKHVELMGQLIGDGASVDEARAQLLDMIGMTHTPVGTAQPDSQANQNRGGPSAQEMIEEALGVRIGTITDEETVKRCQGNNEFAGMTLIEMARGWLRAGGHDWSGNPRQIAERAFSTRQDTTDFPLILANVAEKSLLKAYWDAPETWRGWASVGNINDFKLNSRVNLSEFDTLPVVAEGGTYTEGTFTEVQETIQLATYGMNYSITREALINDDVSAFSRIPTAMGLAAARTVGDLAYSVLTSNPNMSDGFPLFDATNHNNNVTPGGIIDMDSVQAAKVAMALQTGLKGLATLGIRAAKMVVPVGLEGVANELMSAQYNPASTAGTLSPNIVQGLLQVIADHRLDADTDPNAWYVMADQMAWDTVEVGFLNGNQSPYQERRQQDISNDNITYKVRIDAAAAPMDWRGMYRNGGGA